MSDFCGIYVFCTAKLKHLPIPLTTEVARILWQVSLNRVILQISQKLRQTPYFVRRCTRSTVLTNFAAAGKNGWR